MTVLGILGLLILILGITLLGWGFRKTQTLSNKIVEGVTGRYTERTMWTLVVGGAFVLLGLIFLYMGWEMPANPQP